MQARILILLILAGGIGFGTFHFGRQWMESQRPVAQTNTVVEPEVSYVLVADRNLSAGQFVRDSDLRWQAWPDETLADAYIERGEATPEDLSGAVVRSAMGEGEPITDVRLVKPGDRGFLAAVLTPGLRAVSVPVNETTGIAGLVFPGDRVDVILTHTVRPEHGGIGPRTLRASETVLTDIRVLAIDQRLEEDGNDLKVADTVTLEVTSAQAERINVILELGSLSLSLRSLASDAVAAADDPALAMDSVSGGGDGAAEPPKTALNKPAGPGPYSDLAAQTFTLDSDVSMLLASAAVVDAPAPEPEPEAEPIVPAPMVISAEDDTVDVVRGSSYRSGAGN